jgi:hypothetical protein
VCWIGLIGCFAFFEPFIFLRIFHELTHVILMPEAEELRTWSSHGSDGQRPSALVLGPLPLTSGQVISEDKAMCGHCS